MAKHHRLGATLGPDLPFPMDILNCEPTSMQSKFIWMTYVGDDPEERGVRQR